MFPPDFPPLKPLCSRQSLICLVTLFCFLTTSVGFPLEPAGTPQAGCQCGKKLQASKSCCCSRATVASDSESQPRSCCVREQAKTCCATKTKQAPDETAPAMVAACGCGGTPAAGILINQDPRLVGPPTLILSSFLRESCCLRVSFFLPDLCLPPETPPPELCSL